jgi:hypothetical protein
MRLAGYGSQDAFEIGVNRLSGSAWTEGKE